MKVLFLDIDGVLNNESTKERIPDGIFKGMIGVDAKLTKRYLDWLEGKDITVVLSSTWRLDERMMAILNENGIYWSDVTPNMATRHIEVDDWLSRHNYKEFAILDDMPFFKGWLKPHFVQTSYIHGLREKNLRKVEEILGLNPPSSNGRTTDFESVN